MEKEHDVSLEINTKTNKESHLIDPYSAERRYYAIDETKTIAQSIAYDIEESWKRDRRIAADKFMANHQNYAVTDEVCYICSPYWSSDNSILQRNLKYAAELTQQAIALGYAPICTHLYLPNLLPDVFEIYRYTGLRLCLAIIDRCPNILVGNVYGITDGMKLEIERAKSNGCEIFYHTSLKKEKD